MKRRLKRVAGSLAAVLPFPLLRAVFRAWATGLAHQPDRRRAMRELLELDAELQLRVDEAAIRYDDDVHVKHRLMRYHDFFVERVQPGQRVLDIGSGKGELAHDLAVRAGATVVGVDFDRAYLAFARSRFSHPNVEYVEGNATRELPPGKFDVVVLSNVLEHIEERQRLLRTIVASAEPDRVLIRVPAIDRHWTVPLREELGLAHFSDPTHHVEYTVESLARELAAAGLETVHAQVSWGEIWTEARPG